MRPSQASPPSAESRWPPRVAAAVVLAFIATHLLASLAALPLDTDEAWSLLVTRRLLGGERLYADVFAGVTPLSFQLQRLLGSLLQNNVLWTRALTHVVHLLMTACCLASARRAGVSGWWLGALLGGLLVFAAPSPHSIYSYLATALACAALLCALALRTGRGDARRALVAGGLACGLAVATKQNIGALTSLAFALCLVPDVRGVSRQGSRRWMLAAAGWSVGALVPMLPVLLEGSLAPFIRLTVANKVAYVRHASLSYWEFVNLSPFGEIGASGVRAGVAEWIEASPYLLPFVVAVLALAWWRGRRAPDAADAATATVVLFAVAALAGVYPRPDPVHFAIAVPALLLAVVVLLARLAPRLGRAAATVAGLMVIMTWARDVRRIAAAPHAPPTGSLAPELAGLRLAPAAQERMARERAALRTAAAGQPMLIVHLEAARLYLISGVRNPTPFDYPVVNPFGARGQQDVLAAITRNAIRRSCVQPSPWPALEPETLTQGIRREMQRAGDTGSCELFTRPDRAP